jgi:hypothetical protein
MSADPQPATTAVPNADWNPAWAIGRLEALRAKLIERHPEAAEDAELTALFQGVRDELGMVTVAPPAGQDVEEPMLRGTLLSSGIMDDNGQRVGQWAVQSLPDEDAGRRTAFEAGSQWP